MWLLIIPLIIGEPSAPIARIEAHVSAPSREACHAARINLRERMYADWPPGSENEAVALVDQPPGVDVVWSYLSATQIGYCVPALSPTAARTS